MVNTFVQDLDICNDESVTIAFFDQSSSKSNKSYRLNKKGSKNANMSNADYKTKKKLIIITLCILRRTNLLYNQLRKYKFDE